MVGFGLFHDHFEQIVNSKSELTGELCYTGTYPKFISLSNKIRVHVEGNQPRGQYPKIKSIYCKGKLSDS